jgi:hypothetical protein
LINKERIVKEFNLKPFGSKGWMSSSNIKCPLCGRSDKIGILFTNKGGVVHCFYEHEGISLNKYLKEIGRGDLIEGEYYSKPIEEKLENSFEIYNRKVEVGGLEEKEKPFKYRRIYYDEYLDSRGWEPIQYNKYKVGVSEDIRLKKYLIFLLYQENKLVGWLARSKNSKEWHKDNFRRFKENKETLKLRYRNSNNTDFEKILGGYDEITENTKELYLVEGLFDCANVNKQLGLYDNEEIKCCYTFGNYVSEHQAALIRKTNVEKIIILYDFGTNSQVKRCGWELKDYDLRVGEFKQEEIDAGDSSKDYLKSIIKNSKNFYYFYKNRLDVFI